MLGDGRADHRGKGLTEVRSRQRKHCPVTGRIKQCQPHCWQQQDGERKGVFSLSSSRLRKRVLSKSPVLKNGTPGSVRGRFGQLAVLPRWPIASTSVRPDRANTQAAGDHGQKRVSESCRPVQDKQRGREIVAPVPYEPSSLRE